MTAFFASLPTTAIAEVPEQPTGSLLAEVAGHRYGAQMTLTQTTDTLSSNRYPVEFWAMKHNMEVTAFLNSHYGTDDAMIGFGRVKPSVYFPTDRWLNPATGAIELIPDYSSTSWTEAGVAAFSGAVLGASKTRLAPNHGQEMYDISGGVYGYDVGSGTTGTNNLAEFTGVVQAQKDYLRGRYGVEPYAFSYRNGKNITPEVYSPHFIGGRNSGYSWNSPSYTFYGEGLGNPASEVLSRVKQVNRASSMRYYDFFGTYNLGTQADANTFLTQELQATLANGGWFEDFSHWHTADNGEMQQFFETVAGTLNGADVYYAGFEEAIAYMWARSLASIIVDGYTVSLAWAAFDLPEALIVPVSIRVNTTGTGLEGREIASSVGSVVKKGSNDFIVEVPYGTTLFTLSATSSPAYKDLAQPAIGFELSGTTLTVTTDKPCRVMLWKAVAGAAESTLVAPVRSTGLNTMHSFQLTSTELSGDIYIGALAENGRSRVIKPAL